MVLYIYIYIYIQFLEEKKETGRYIYIYIYIFSFEKKKRKRVDLITHEKNELDTKKKKNKKLPNLDLIIALSISNWGIFFIHKVVKSNITLKTYAIDTLIICYNSFFIILEIIIFLDLFDYNNII
jgi:hypothetical protein